MKKIFFLFVIVALISSSVRAQVPQTISYQGFYTDASGNPVTGGPHKIAFRFLDATSNVENTGLAREIENVAINKGIISVVIGGGDPSNTTAPDNAPLPFNVWTQAFKIQVLVDGTSIGGAVPLTTVPYAFVAGSVDGANITGNLDAAKVSGTLPGTQVGTGISATNITTGTFNPALFADGSIPGSKLSLDISASSIATGTLADARLEPTLDVTGVNTSGNVTTGGGVHVGGTSDPGVDNLLVDGTITGNGSGITTLNASNISSGTIADARLETNVDLAGFLTTVGGVHVGGTSNPGTDNLVVDGTITGNGSGITTLNASNISSGTIADARLESTLDVTAVNTSGNISAGGTISGIGSGLTTLNASNISSGTLANARLATNVDVAGALTTVNGLHVGSATAPGTDNLEVDGFTKLGVEAAAPLIKMKKLTGTTAAAEGSEVLLAHGLTLAKIISITVIVEATATFHIHEGFTNNVEFQFNWYLTDTQIRVWNTTGNSGSILSKPLKILITYEQ